MLEVSHGKSLSGSFVFAGLAYGLLLFFVVLVWFLPERAEVLAHFRAYMLPAIIFGLMGRVMYRYGERSAERVGKFLLGIAYLSCGAFIGLFIYTFMTGH
jgi:hypothetical protein